MSLSDGSQSTMTLTQSVLHFKNALDSDIVDKPFHRKGLESMLDCGQSPKACLPREVMLNSVVRRTVCRNAIEEKEGPVDDGPQREQRSNPPHLVGLSAILLLLICHQEREKHCRDRANGLKPRRNSLALGFIPDDTRAGNGESHQTSNDHERLHQRFPIVHDSISYFEGPILA
jgi:hypothetical protein